MKAPRRLLRRPRARNLPGQPPPRSHRSALCRIIGRIDSGLSAARNRAAEGSVRYVSSRLIEKSHRRQGVEDDRQRAQIGADPGGDLAGGERRSRRQGEEVELRAGQKDAAFHKGPAQGHYRLLAPFRLIAVLRGHGISPPGLFYGDASASPAGPPGSIKAPMPLPRKHPPGLPVLKCPFAACQARRM